MAADGGQVVAGFKAVGSAAVGWVWTMAPSSGQMVAEVAGDGGTVVTPAPI